MDDPVNDIADVVHALTSGPPREQAEAINAYFTTDAAFIHPFCRVGRHASSRQFIHYIFRWYKVLSPKVVLDVNSVAFDEKNAILYLNMTQVFAIWFIPFYRAKVTLTTLLHLQKWEDKYFIASQEDLYQTDQMAKFILPFGGQQLVMLWHFISTMFCALLALIFMPFTILMQILADRQEYIQQLKEQAQEKQQNGSLTNGKPVYEQARDAANEAGQKIKNAAGRAGDQAEDATDTAEKQTKDAAGKAEKETKRATGKAGDKAEEAADRAKDAAGEANEQAKGVAGKVRKESEKLWNAVVGH